jgi:hypothetical protein
VLKWQIDVQRLAWKSWNAKFSGRAMIDAEICRPTSRQPLRIEQTDPVRSRHSALQGGIA